MKLDKFLETGEKVNAELLKKLKVNEFFEAGKKINYKLLEKAYTLKEFKETYELVHKLSSINGFELSEKLFNRTMFNSETLPVLGKEYWWFLFIGKNMEKPIQLMFMVFRKHGPNMLFNDKKMDFELIGKNKFKAVSTCWIWDGEELKELGDDNVVTEVDSEQHALTSAIAGHKVVFKGDIPNFEFKIGNIVDLKMSKLNQIDEKDAYGVFLPPLGAGWVDAFSVAEGTVCGKKFEGTAQLQKVVGIIPPVPFNWAYVFFKNGSSASFFCVKPKKDSKNLFNRSFSFYNSKNDSFIEFKNPDLKISKKGSEDKPEWTAEGKSKENSFRMVLETYARKEFRMESNGWQVYIEFAVIVKEFSLKTESERFELSELGRGIGTFEDAYGFVF